MKQLVFLLAISAMLIIAAIIVSCTDNDRVKKYGGTEEITLPPGQRLVNITWKDDADLWLLVKQDSITPPAVYEFQQKRRSALFNSNGKVVITESK